MHSSNSNGQYDKASATKQLENAASLFSERNQLESLEPFVEKIFLINAGNESIYHIYYPTTVTRIKIDQLSYTKLYDEFENSGKDFYYQVKEDYVNLCMWLYDEEMKQLGACIFVLNKSGIESNYANLENMQHFKWRISQGEQTILGKETISEKHAFPLLENTIHTSFGLTLYVGVSELVIWQSLATTVFVIFLISVLVIVLLSVMGHLLGVQYVKPLETVAEKIELVGQGNFDTKLDEYSAEELQRISETFNSMTDYINRLVKEVYETELIAQQARIKYLQAQMNPHFLFNVLSMIEMKAAVNQDNEVKDMIYKLSKLYQGKIFRKNEIFIYLEEEMEIVDFYLSLQNGRFGEKITYSIAYEGGKDLYQQYKVPRLSIEPIVENAVCHGLEPKEGKGHIHVEVSKTENMLVIQINDDGVGFDTNALVENTKDRKHSHVGIWNTNKMISNLCGEEYGLQVSSEIGKVHNGQELITYINKDMPDIIITDVRMPLMTGIEVAKYVYEQMLPIKVIILSAYAEFEYAQEAIKYDVCGYIVKTSVIEMLPTMIQKAIGKLTIPSDDEKEEIHSEDIFGKLQRYIEANYKEKLTLTQISNEIHANGSYLSRLYKLKTGQNLFDAINKIKLEKAKEYMKRGSKIYEAAQLVGFDDVSYFSRVFKKHEGCSPREYEKKTSK